MKSLPAHASVSQRETAARCGRAYREKYGFGAKGDPAAWTHQGTAFHDAINHFEKSRRTATTEECQAVYDEVWRHENERARERQPELNYWLRGGNLKTETDIDARFKLGREQVAEYIDYASAEGKTGLVPFILPDERPATEMGFKVPIGGQMVLGYIDLVLLDETTGRLMVRDLKTGKLPIWPIQLGVYRRALKHCFDLDVRWGDYFLAKQHGPCPPIDLYDFDDELLDQEFTALGAQKREGAWLTNPGDHCRVCDLKRTCPTQST